MRRVAMLLASVLLVACAQSVDVAIETESGGSGNRFVAEGFCGEGEPQNTSATFNDEEFELAYRFVCDDGSGSLRVAVTGVADASTGLGSGTWEVTDGFGDWEGASGGGSYEGDLNAGTETFEGTIDR